MIIGFFGASGRTDASHCALLAFRALRSVEPAATLIVMGPGAVNDFDDSPRAVEVTEGAEGPVTAFRAAVASRATGTGTVVADLPRPWLDLAGVRSVLDVAVVVVGPHRSDEQAAAAAATSRDEGRVIWHLGCRRGGGGPAAARFAAEMARIAPGIRTLPLALPTLGRGEAAALGRSDPSGRTLRSGLLLLTAIQRAAEAPSAVVPPSPGTGTPGDERIAAPSDVRSLADKLRDLADDVEAAEAGLAPDPVELANAPILDGWSLDAGPAPILKGRVTGHPNVADGHRARTTEVYLTDRATYGRTLSRWYRLRIPAGAAANGLQ